VRERGGGGRLPGSPPPRGAPPPGAGLVPSGEPGPDRPGGRPAGPRRRTRARHGPGGGRGLRGGDGDGGSRPAPMGWGCGRRRGGGAAAPALISRSRFWPGAADVVNAVRCTSLASPLSERAGKGRGPPPCPPEGRCPRGTWWGRRGARTSCRWASPSAPGPHPFRVPEGRVPPPLPRPRPPGPRRGLRQSPEAIPTHRVGVPHVIPKRGLYLGNRGRRS